MIKWNLGQIIATYRISKSRLAELIDVQPSAITNLCKSSNMPRIDGNRLNGLINAINDCLSEMNNSAIISLNDLLEYIPDRR